MNKKNTIFNLQRAYPINDRVARVLATTRNLQDQSERDFADLIQEKFEGKVSLIPGTVQDVSTNHSEMVSAFLELNVESRPYNGEELSGFKAVTANCFEDENDKVWNVVGEGEGRRLVQFTNDKIDTIMAERVARSSGFVTASFEPMIDFTNLELVAFFDTRTNTVEAGLGVIVAEDGRTRHCVMPIAQPADGPATLIEISAEKFMTAAPFKDEDGEVVAFDLKPWEITAALDAARVNEVLEYYRKIYARFPEYWAVLSARIKQVLSVA